MCTNVTQCLEKHTTTYHITMQSLQMGSFKNTFHTCSFSFRRAYRSEPTSCFHMHLSVEHWAGGGTSWKGIAPPPHRANTYPPGQRIWPHTQKKQTPTPPRKSTLHGRAVGILLECMLVYNFKQQM